MSFHRPLFLRAFAALIVAAVLLWASAAPARAGSLEADGGHVVRWDGDLDVMARRVRKQIPVLARQVAASLGFELRGGPAEVVLVSSLPRMREEAGAHVPDWAAGVCVSARSRIVLRADLLRGSGPVRTMTTTLRHEWVHLAWGRRAGKHARRLPLWVEEGLAESIGGGVTVDGGARLDFAARFGTLIPLAEIKAHWPARGADAALAYRQGRSWVQFFVDRNGWDSLQRILGDLADGEGESASLAAGAPFDELVFEHSSATLSFWNATWRKHLEETAAPWFHLLLRDFMGTIFFLIAVLGGVAFFFIRRRRRRQISELPDDPHPAEHLAGPDVG